MISFLIKHIFYRTNVMESIVRVVVSEYSILSLKSVTDV